MLYVQGVSSHVLRGAIQIDFLLLQACTYLQASVGGRRIQTFGFATRRHGCTALHSVHYTISIDIQQMLCRKKEARAGRDRGAPGPRDDVAHEKDM